MDENLYFLTCAPDIYIDGRIKGAPFPCFYVSPTDHIINMPLERFRKCYLEGTRLSVLFRVYDGVKVSEDNTIYLLDIAGYDTFEQLHLSIFEKSQGPDLIPGLRYQVTFKDYVTLPTVTTFGFNDDGTAIELSISNQPPVSLDITGLQITGTGDTITNLEISPDSRTITLSADNPTGTKQLVIGLDPIVDSIATNTTAITTNTSAIAALTTRVTAEEAATAQAILRDGGLSFERCIADLSPDIVMTSQNVFPTDITNIFSATTGVVVNNGSSLGGATVLTNPVGKRSLLLPSFNTLKWHTPNV